MKIGEFDTDREVLVVAEIGNNHEGDYGLAEKLVHLAAESGAQAVKFQTFKTELLVNKSEERRFKQLKSYELTFPQFENLSALAAGLGLLFISTPCDLESASFLKDIVAAFKIASGDNTFYPLLKSVAATGLPVIMSAGLADMDQLRYSRDVMEDIWAQHHVSPDLAVLHCVSAYPAPARDVNLRVIETLREEFGCTIGYSDHTLGIESAVLAVALGARIIEKHFTIDKNHSDFRDHQLSADPQEMRLLVRRIREADELLGSRTKAMRESEEAVLPAVRRSIAASHDLFKGAVVSPSDIMWTRPSGGLPPGSEDRVVGKRLLRDTRMGEPILPEDVVEGT